MTWRNSAFMIVVKETLGYWCWMDFSIFKGNLLFNLLVEEG